MPRRKDGKETAARASAAEKAYRYNRLFQVIRNGGTTHDCIRFAVNTWGISETTARKYIPEVRALVRKDFELDRAQFAAELMQQASSIQMEARRTGNLAVALGAVNALAKLAAIL
jgi:hypothetical protein